MQYYDLEPISKPHSNDMLGGRPALPHEIGVIGGKVNGMPVSKNDQRILSVWKCESLWARVQFLLRGEITLTVLGRHHPAIAVSVNDTIACGSEVKNG